MKIIPVIFTLSLSVATLMSLASVPRGVRALRPIQADDPSGEYVMSYMPVFDNYPCRDLTQVVRVECGDSAVALHGFAGWDAAYFGDGAVRVDTPVMGRMGDGAILIEAGQRLGAFGVYDAVLMAMGHDGQLMAEGVYDLEIGDESIESSCGWVVAAINHNGQVAGSICGADMPVLHKPSGRVRYTCVKSDSDTVVVDMPVCYGFTIDDEGVERMEITSINPWRPDCFITSWTVRGDKAVAIEQVEESRRLTLGATCAYMLCTLFDYKDDTYYTKEIRADIADRANITWPVGSNTLLAIPYDGRWSMIDHESGRYYGVCGPVTLTALGDDSEPMETRSAAGGDASPVPVGAGDEPQSQYFNLRGERVDNPGRGIYIRREGEDTTKRVVK